MHFLWFHMLYWLILIRLLTLSLSVFRYWLQGRAEKLERSTIAYACLAKVIREGGLKVAVLARYSIIPGHRE